MAPLVEVVFMKRIPKKSKFDWFANKQYIHEVLDFLAQDSYGQQILLPWM